jgi:hypothetical protein
MLLGIIFITITLQKRKQSIQETRVKKIQQFLNEIVIFYGIEDRRTRSRSDTFRRDFFKHPPK